MSANNGAEVFEKIMSANLQRATDFLKYAEAKNGVLLTFGSAWILAIIGLLSNEKSLPIGIGTVLAISLPFFIGAVILAMLSFFPQMSWALFVPSRRPRQNDSKNPLFFGDIASMTFPEFERSVRERYFPTDDQPMTNEYLHDLSVQVFANSKIVKRKLWLFEKGLLMIAVAAAILLIPLLDAVMSKFWGH
jgi:hypothetical protein